MRFTMAMITIVMRMNLIKDANLRELAGKLLVENVGDTSASVEFVDWNLLAAAVHDLAV